jgi:hypothetical protein
MTIEQQRVQYATIRNSLPQAFRAEWRNIEQAFKDLDVPPTPSEWVAEVSKYSSEVSQYESALERWIKLRMEDEAGWGEDYSPSQIEGWRDDLDLRTKTSLLRLAFNEDLNTMISYEDWRADRDW